jgi:hypothetical protein
LILEPHHSWKFQKLVMLRASELSDRYTYRGFLLIDLNLTPSAIAFCATAPRVRRSFFAATGPESLAFARAFKAFTSSFDHGRITRRFFFAIATPQRKTAHCTHLAQYCAARFRAQPARQ